MNSNKPDWLRSSTPNSVRYWTGYLRLRFFTRRDTAKFGKLFSTDSHSWFGIELRARELQSSLVLMARPTQSNCLRGCVSSLPNKSLQLTAQSLPRFEFPRHTAPLATTGVDF